jgi:hypothetical protein
VRHLLSHQPAAAAHCHLEHQHAGLTATQQNVLLHNRNAVKLTNRLPT